MQQRQKKVSASKVKAKQPATRRKSKAQTKPVWQLAAEARALATPEEWAQLPADLSQNFDHYHYGAGRKKR